MAQGSSYPDRTKLGINLVVRVTDANNSRIAAGVALQEFGTLNRVSSTNESGDCFFPSVPPGDYVLVVSIHGREQWREQLVLGRNEASHTELIRLPLVGGRAASRVSVRDLNIPREARKNYRLGISNAHNARWRKAEANFRDAVTECPAYMRAFNALGVVLVMQQRNAEAEVAFRKAIALDSKFGEAHLNLGNLLITLNRPQEALIELQNVLSADPTNRKAIPLLVGTYLAVRDDDSGMRIVDYAHFT